MTMAIFCAIYILYFQSFLHTGLSDRNYAAIKDVHAHLDDNKDGIIDIFESKDYLKSELQYSNTSRENVLHKSNPKISVKSLWEKWKNNEVNQWKVSDVITWLKNIVKLPEYESNFLAANVDGSTMPSLATPKVQFVKEILLINNTLHRKMIYLCASDAILFGPPKEMKMFDESFLALKMIYDQKENVIQSRPQGLLFASKYISLDDLWDKWQKNEAYNWNNSQLIQWLTKTVELPQYQDIFHTLKATGKYIPRLTDEDFLKNISISVPLHRNTLAKNSADIILRGLSSMLDKNFLAIKAVHEQLDDDKDGEIDLEESSEFMEEELNTPRSKRPSSLHQTDNHISVEELWVTWQKSEVYNWTIDDVVKWLNVVVGLPKYEKPFREKNISGKDIPRLTTEKFLVNDIGISDTIHRKKIVLRSSDIILFGIPDEIPVSYFKDIIVLSVILFATLFCLYAFREKKRTQNQIEQMTKDLEYLQLAEDNLKNMQNILGASECNVNDNYYRESQLIEEIETARKEAELLRVEKYGKNEEDKMKLSMIEQELSDVRLQLLNAQKQLGSAQIKSPKMLQKYLVMTYKKETKHFLQRKQMALSQMKEAKEACAKVSKSRRSMLGVLRLAHSESIDDVDEKIVTARASLAEVTNDLQERQHRWKQIESLLNFEIVSGILLNYSNEYAERKYSVERALADATVVATMSDCSTKVSRDSEDDIEIEQINSCKMSEPTAEFYIQNDQYIPNRSDVQKVYPIYAKSSSGNSQNSIENEFKFRESENESPNSQFKRKVSISNSERSFFTESSDNDLNKQRKEYFSRGNMSSKSESISSISSDAPMNHNGKTIIRVNTESSALDERLLNITPNLEKRSKSFTDIQKDSSHCFTMNEKLNNSSGSLSLSISDIKKKKGFTKLFRSFKK
ncbi:uncharacterized protein LOC100198735 isoform X2 [Hydra vulgaris]|uniref:Uncharacterized protein LOC100198735 isoform X2 n=1 Tax=Hydra vulgaris TaxID=6087 RepID=A0ABM4CZZ2_HYDVU